MKAKENKKDPLLAILEWPNNPSQGIQHLTSPEANRSTHPHFATNSRKLLRPNSDMTTTASNLTAMVHFSGFITVYPAHWNPP